jgi:hypothetical protein
VEKYISRKAIKESKAAKKKGIAKDAGRIINWPGL